VYDDGLSPYDWEMMALMGPVQSTSEVVFFGTEMSGDCMVDEQ
jgi:hypothetical protein